MLPDHMRDELVQQVRDFFGVEDRGLEVAALELQDSGWQWEQICLLLIKAFNAGYNAGHDDGCEDGYNEGYEHAMRDET